ncbi:hypothetical protein, partial [Limosilactobacillus reuteri]|uniref:hypothetical protein n=1 Tax=Limosilactobacillus reuteri TaxID=1598 RepID=UPI00207D6195
AIGNDYLDVPLLTDKNQMLTFTPDISKRDISLPTSREGHDINCFLDVVKPSIPDDDLEELSEKYSNGIEYTDMLQLAKRYKFQFVIYDQLGNI